MCTPTRCVVNARPTRGAPTLCNMCIHPPFFPRFLRAPSSVHTSASTSRAGTHRKPTPFPPRCLLPRFFRRSSAFTSSRSHPPFACPQGRAGRCPGNADAFLPRYLPRNLPRFFRGCGLVAVFSTEKLIADRPQAFLFEGVSEDSICVTCMQVPSLGRSARLACAGSLQHPNDASLGCCNDPAQARCAQLACMLHSAKCARGGGWERGGGEGRGTENGVVEREGSGGGGGGKGGRQNQGAAGTPKKGKKRGGPAMGAPY